MKICQSCKQTKPFSDFNKNKTKKDGYGDKCRKCMKGYRKCHYEANKKIIIKKNNERIRHLRIWLKQYKSTLKCERCGENHPATLEFHHKNPKQKEFIISSAVTFGYGKEHIMREINKCATLCANCHRKTHWHAGLV